MIFYVWLSPPKSMAASLPPFLSLHACALILLLCSFPTSCHSNKWENYCNTVNRCGNFKYSYPFGKIESGCGDKEFQLACDPVDHHPMINIQGNDYHISEPHILGNDNSNHSIMIVHDNLWRDQCKLLDNYTQSWLYDYKFQVAYGYTNITFWRDCDQSNSFEKNYTLKMLELSLCGDVWYYSFSQEIDLYGAYFCKTHLQLPIKSEALQLNQSIDNHTLLRQGFEVTWHVDPYRNQSCGACWSSNGVCGYNVESTVFVCYCKEGTQPDNCPSQGRKNKSAIVIGCSTGGVALTAIALGLLLTFYKKRRKQPPIRSSISKVENFLREYASEMPTRYSQSDIKKITNNFLEKLGEGGFGVVYKGKLRNGALVAVKLLDRQRHSEIQFMNEVATIGRVHHVNLVRLLGYCFESITSALVYEYMINGSLEKFIYAGKEKEPEKGHLLRWEQFHSIALGAARGIAYLHHDCEKRIIHFDIKPHNILLDTKFTPKVSDFGLAKLCGKGEDHISMTFGRGTPGYVAPEVCDPDLGPVTDKSDVYSFGMLLLEIVGGRKNLDWKASRSSQFYFPEWAFKLVETGVLATRLSGRGGEMEAEDEEKARKLTKVGLWCIQYNSRDRPSMSRVVQMLEGNGEDVANPPSPFNFSATLEDNLPSSTEISCSM